MKMAVCAYCRHALGKKDARKPVTFGMKQSVTRILEHYKQQTYISVSNPNSYEDDIMF